MFHQSKIRLYGGAGLFYKNFFLDSTSFGAGLNKTHQLNINLSLGAEYSINNTFDLFLEPSIMSTTIFEKNKFGSRFEPDNLKFLNNARFGVSLRF